MKKNKKTILMILLVTSLLILIPVITVAAAQLSGKGVRVAPPVMRVDNEPTRVVLDPYAENGHKLFDAKEKAFCLGYLNSFKKETVAGGESTEEAERITYKNALIQEYKDYVNSLYMRVMTLEEYDAHYEHLMHMFQEMIPLDAEPTPQEQLETDLRLVLVRLEDKLYECEVYGESYIEGHKIHVEELKQSIQDITSLQEKYRARQLPFEQAQQEYAACLETIRTACPPTYAAMADPEPEPNAFEQFQMDMKLALARLKAKLYCCETYGEAYISKNRINMTELKQCMEDMTALYETYDRLPFEQAQQEYAANVEAIQSASPSLYALMTADEPIQ